MKAKCICCARFMRFMGYEHVSGYLAGRCYCKSCGITEYVKVNTEKRISEFVGDMLK